MNNNPETASAHQPRPSDQPEWSAFWDNEGLVTEYAYQPAVVVPREYQPSSHVCLADVPLGAIAIRQTFSY